ncbi:MAG: YlmC/YmxH family sporulation protein [Syntrophomonadaceae bacterium]|mgnify:CR=1 FL=1|nr:YlmC/YmxH family sporulation protein [Syntrophomonadaceae bacterium]
MVRVSDLRMRDVVNVVDGRRLGMIKDFDLDVELGRIKSIVLPGTGKILGFFGRNEDLEISWERIIKIGVDVILVDLPGFTEVRHRNEKEDDWSGSS